MAQSPPYAKGRRLRLFAGPNGSGKSTIINQIKSTFDVGYYINPDDLEQSLRSNPFINLDDFGIEISSESFNDFLQNHSLYEKAKSSGFSLSISVKHNKIYNHIENQYSYEAALISDFLRNELIKIGKKFTLESVMSHPSKIEALKMANRNKYKTYLYFVCTATPKINIERVELRVKKGGHNVQEERYYRCLELLKEAVQHTYRSFVWDNSDKAPKLILEVSKGNEITFHSAEVPQWVSQYLLKT